MFSSDEFVRVKADVAWAMINYSRLKDNEKQFVRDLHEQVLAYGQFMHMTAKQQAWFEKIIERISDEASNGGPGNAGN